MIVHPRQQHRPRRRAEWRGAMLAEDRATLCQGINIWRRGFTAKDAKIHQGGIIHQHDDDVGACFRLRRQSRKCQPENEPPAHHEVVSTSCSRARTCIIFTAVSVALF